MGAPEGGGPEASLDKHYSTPLFAVVKRLRIKNLHAIPVDARGTDMNALESILILDSGGADTLALVPVEFSNVAVQAAPSSPPASPRRPSFPSCTAAPRTCWTAR